MTIRRSRVAWIVLLLATHSAAQVSRPVAREPSRARPGALPRIYDLRDLLPEGGPDEAGPLPPREQDPLVRAIRGFIPPPIEGHDLTLMNGQLIATVTEVQHEWLMRFLMAKRKPVPDIFRVETQFVVAPVEEAARIGLNDGLPVYVGDDVALSVVRDEIAAMKRVFIGPIEATEVVNGRPGREETFSELTFIKAYERHADVEPGNRTLVVPVLATEREGTFLDVLVTTLPDDRIGCVLTATLTQIEKPVPSRETPDGPIAVPVVTTMSIEAKASFDGKMTIVFAGPVRDGRLPFVLAKVSLKPPGRSPEGK
jgi:hypothetical protein